MNHFWKLKAKAQVKILTTPFFSFDLAGLLFCECCVAAWVLFFWTQDGETRSFGRLKARF